MSDLAQHPSRVNLAPKSMRFWLMAHKIAAGFGAGVEHAGPPGAALGACVGPDASGAFLFSVTGDSMSGAGIMPGDRVIVDRSVAPAHGQLVIAVVDAEYALQRLFHFNGRFELRTESAHAPVVRSALDAPPQVWGVVVGVIRNYRN